MLSLTKKQTSLTQYLFYDNQVLRMESVEGFGISEK